jgi:hypothetical protein
MLISALIFMICRNVSSNRAIPLINFGSFSIVLGCLHTIPSSLVNEGFEGVEFVIQ